MSKTLVQPVGQKRLTNVAVVRLKKRGRRFEIACYKNKVLSWRTGVEKDIDEVLQSQTVYSNVSKGVLAKSSDLQYSFGTDDQTKVCLEILEKGELQVAGKEREMQFASQFRDIATIVMQRTINPETQRPYTISMIERLMHEIHFAVDPNSNSKKQALEVIRELQKHYPIKRAPMKLRFTVAEQNFPSLLDKLNNWNASNITKDESGSQKTATCEMEPGFYRDAEALMRNLQGRVEVLAYSVHAEGDTQVECYDEHEEVPAQVRNSDDTLLKLSDKMQRQTISSGKGTSVENEVKKNKCNTCNAVLGDSKDYRDHFKSDWHKHNLKRKTRNLPPLSAEECLADIDLEDSKADLKEYSF